MKYIGIPEHQYLTVPELGTQVLFTIGKENRIYSGIIVKCKTKDDWCVKTPSGKSYMPYLSELLKPGTKLPRLKAIIVEE